MRFLLIFIICIHASFVTSSFGFLEPETTKINVVLPKAARNFLRINLDKSETVNEKNFNNNDTINSETTTESEIPLNSTTTESIETKQPLVPDESNPESNRSVLWFFGGALAGVILSFIVFYVYSFFKTRTSSIYQNL